MLRAGIVTDGSDGRHSRFFFFFCPPACRADVFFRFLFVNRIVLCKFAQLYADETTYHLTERGPARAVERLLRRGGHPPRAAREDRLVPRKDPHPDTRFRGRGRRGGAVAVLYHRGQHGLPVYHQLLPSQPGVLSGGDGRVEGHHHLPGLCLQLFEHYGFHVPVLFERSVVTGGL